MLRIAMSFLPRVGVDYVLDDVLYVMVICVASLV